MCCYCTVHPCVDNAFLRVFLSGASICHICETSEVKATVGWAAFQVTGNSLRTVIETKDKDVRRMKYERFEDLPY